MKKYIKVVSILLMFMVVNGCSVEQTTIDDNEKITAIPTEPAETIDTDTLEIPSAIITISPEPNQEVSITAIPANEEIKDSEIKEYKTYTWYEIDELIYDMDDLTDPLVEEYIYWMHELDKEYSPKNLIMAYKYRNIAGAFFFNKEAHKGDGHTDWSKVTPNAQKYMRENNYVPIIYEMTSDFIQLTAIVQPIGDEYKEFYSLINETRNSEKEVEFLKGLEELGYYAVDVYIDDILLGDREIPCNGIRLYEGYYTDLKEVYDNITEIPEDDDLKEYLSIYDRQVNIGKQLNNKEWNLFLFNKRDTQPASISLHIRTYELKGGIGLEQRVR